MRQRLLLNALNASLELQFLLGGLHLVSAHVLDGIGEKATSATGWVQDHLAELWVDHVYGKLGDSAGGIVFASVTGALQVAQELLVDVAKKVTLTAVVEVDLFLHLVDHLAQQNA